MRVFHSLETQLLNLSDGKWDNLAIEELISSFVVANEVLH